MGYYAFGEKRPKHKVLTEMFYLLEARGHDACGWAWQDKEGKLQLFKVARRSSEVIKTPYWKFPPLAKSMIFHTRAATQGTVKDSRNNHPLLGKEGKRVLVHNGIISNEHQFGITTDKVDSLAILRALESEDDPVVGLNKLQGSFAIGVLHADSPDLILARHYSPIEVIYDKLEDILYFASELRMLTGPLQVKSKVLRGIEFNSDRFCEVDFPDDTLWLINQKGLKSVHKLSPQAYASYGYSGQRWGGTLLWRRLPSRIWS